MPGDEAPAGWLPVRREGGRIVVDLPARVRRFLTDTAQAVQRSVEDPASPGFGRLFGRLDEDAEIDDPLVSLERQTMIDDLCATVVASARKDGLSDGEAEAWLRVLGMAVMLTAANAGIRTEADAERVGGEVSELLDLLRALQLLVARSLDPTLEDLADPGGPEAH